MGTGLLLCGFGYWGTTTRAGRRTYDGMDGIIPFGAIVLGVGGLLLGATIVLLALFLTRRKSRGARGFDVIRSGQPDRDEGHSA